MARIVLATSGSLGDIHPMIALGIELKSRGHNIVFATMNLYREKIEAVGFEFRPLRPHLELEDRELARQVMDIRKGPEVMIRNIVFPHLHEIYNDLMAAIEGADIFLSGEVIYVANSAAQKSGIKWISTSLSPISMFSNYDPGVYPAAEWLEYLRFLPPAFHEVLFSFMRWTISDWFEPYKAFRRDLGLSEDHDPVFRGKASDLLHLVMFSRVMEAPQPDWFPASVQTGFCFYDGQNDTGKMPDGLEEFFAAADIDGPPIIFTLGSAAVMDAGDFFEESIKAAKALGRRSVSLYGLYNEPPAGLDDNNAGFQYAPYSRVFSKAACVVHQGGIGTTSQVLRAGVPMLVMPYAHDQPDNAARCRRAGVARIISRSSYTAARAAEEIRPLLAEASYREKALEAKGVVNSESGTRAACDAIESALKN
ncbi:MAG TPA: nucleotide disphospho-sugar-binding domain-containing protein [Pyrinomonadaceae bacterium]|jgi:UDP:flavonoid glycosyltransferase YjiC (YdhE family)|nr:nucleotide disphospho-sugar-binding domain-containing protein [Pyrinomonadaceae bacterium]